MRGKTQGCWIGSTVKGKGRAVFGINLQKFSIGCCREFYVSSGPLFMQYVQEFSIKQGVVGSQTRVNLSFIWEFSGNRGRISPGLEVFSMKKRWVFKTDFGDVSVY